MPKDGAHTEKNVADGLARLRAESRRFQDELRCISSSLCCPHPHQSHGHAHAHGNPSSSTAGADDQSSDNSVWDSPHTLKQIVTRVGMLPDSVSFSHASVQAGIGCDENGNGKDPEQGTSSPQQYCEYSVDSPVSVQQRNVGTALEYDAGQENPMEITCRDASTSMQSRVHDEQILPAAITKESSGRITATTVFTANGGRLVLRAPSPSILQASIVPSGEVAVESQSHSQATNPRGNVEWKNSTTLTIRSDPNHICTGSVMIREENSSGQTKDVNISTCVSRSNEAAMKDSNQVNDGSGIPIYHTEISLESFTPQKANGDESDNNKLHGSGSSMKLIKLKNAGMSVGKDNVLARRMAARIKFMLQTLDSNKQAGRDQFHYSTLKQGITLRNHHDVHSNPPNPPYHVKHSGSLDQNHILKIERILDPESYLEDVVLALSSSGYPSHAEELHEEERLTTEGGHEVVHKLPPQPAKLNYPPKIPMEKDEGKRTNPNATEDYVSGIQPSRVEDTLLEYSTDSTKPQEMLPQHSKSSDIAREAVDYHVETEGNQIFVKDENVHLFSHRSEIDNPNSAFLQDCRKKVCHLLEGNLLLEKQRRTSGAIQKGEGLIINEHEMQQSTFQERDCMNEAGLNMPDHLEAQFPSSKNINFLDGHVSLILKPDGGNAEKQFTSTVRREPQPKIKSPRSSVLDSAVEAAVLAANDLAKNLAHGITSDVANTSAEQMNDAQRQRKTSATKAVQVLLGEGFDYGSMYQDLKMLQVERRKLEGRSKATVQFQKNLKGAALPKQDKLYGQQLLRRKAEAGDGSLSASDAKRQRMTKSPNRCRDPRSTGWKHERTEKNQALPTYMSSIGISMADHWNMGIEHQFPTNMSKETKRKPIYTRIQDQGKTKVRAQRPKGGYQRPQNIDVKKKSTTPPDWVERMTQGRPSHVIHEFQIKDPIGTSTTKNLVIRRSVRPPGSIFKTSNLIQWTSETTCIQNANPQNKNKGKLKSAENFRIKPKCPNMRIFEVGSSSKHVQNLDIFDQEERTTGSKADTNVSVNIIPEEEKDEKKKLIADMITDVQSPDSDSFGNYENAPKDLDAKKSFVETLLRDIAEHSRKKHMKNEYTQQAELAVSGMLTEQITDETGPVENTDDYKGQLEDEITQGALLAMALQSILNDQSSDNNESRDLIQPKDLDPNNCKISDCETLQQCKSVQTESNSAAPASVYTPFPLLPAYHLPDGNIHPPPPLFYIPCTSGNFPCGTATEQVNSSTTTSHRRKKNLSWRNTHKYSSCSRYMSVRQQESSSSVTTPSSPASIHEIEDLCETGWNHPIESSAAVLPFPKDANGHEMEQRNREEESSEKYTRSRNDAITEISKQGPTAPGLSHHQGGRVSGEEELQIERRSPLMAAVDPHHTHLSVQRRVKEAVSKLEIPSMALVSQKTFSAHLDSGIIVPSWAEIKRPMRESSSSQNLSSSTGGVSSFTSNSSLSIGELQQKAFAILRDSVSTSHVSLGVAGNGAQERCDDISEGELNTVFGGDDLVELGEVILERLPVKVGDSVSSEGAEMGEILL